MPRGSFGEVFAQLAHRNLPTEPEMFVDWNRAWIALTDARPDFCDALFPRPFDARHLEGKRKAQASRLAGHSCQGLRQDVGKSGNPAQMREADIFLAPAGDQEGLWNGRWVIGHLRGKGLNRNCVYLDRSGYVCLNPGMEGMKPFYSVWNARSLGRQCSDGDAGGGGPVTFT